MVTYRLEKNGEFVISDYNLAKPHASFFPGIAGLWGIPLWVFYVNRAQGIVSAGVRSKDEAIMEFWPANKAYQLVSSHGFRTFIKARRGSRSFFYEPFSVTGTLENKSLSNQMRIRPDLLKLVETNAALGLEIQVSYFTVPEAPYAALAREVTVTNTSRKPVSLELCDGLPVILPYGVNNWFLKEMGRTIEAWMMVDQARAGIPLFKLTTDPRDTAQVSFVKGAHFYLSVVDGKDPATSKIVIDPRVLFGPVTDLSFPALFAAKGSFVFPKMQVARNLTPCVMTCASRKLAGGATLRICSLVGHVIEAGDVERFGLAAIRDDFFASKKEENRKMIQGLMHRIKTTSAQAVFDLYAQQTYLDNVLRGGIPKTWKLNKGQKNIYVFSRKHGDLERDYNKFQVAPTYFSEGEGNYRDVNQNRRSDIFFEPCLGEQNIREFMNLIQLDGYNPLVFKGEKFVIPADTFMQSALGGCFAEGEARKLSHVMSRPFGLGELLMFIDEHRMHYHGSREDLVAGILELASGSTDAAFGEGYWSDHWTYNTDLLESFTAVYPERLSSLLLEDKTYTFFDSHVFVKPRCERVTMVHGEARQYHSLGHDELRAALIQKRAADKHKVRVNMGDGTVLETTLAAKFTCLIANKLATLDPGGVGISMEADKPNWYDSINGLPGLFGSSVSETFELKRLVIFLRDWISQISRPEDYSFEVPSELATFLAALEPLLEGDWSDFDYWDKANAAKEAYRFSVQRGVDGALVKMSLIDLSLFLGKAKKKLDQATEKSFDAKTGACATYFSYRMKRYETSIDPSGKHSVVAKEFEQTRLPLFLEGFVHAMRTEKESAAALHRALRKSPLWDRKLGMYKLNASLEGESFEIGRTRAFTRGWLENESIWLHMEYKYMLELLKNGLFDEFYKDFTGALVCFQKPGVYGRSILENSSFIVSGAHPDASLHGAGFVARLSGSTAEFIHMWLLMNLGPNPFFVDEKGRLAFRLRPALACKLFVKKAAREEFIDKHGRLRLMETPAHGYSFLFLGSTVVTYVNAKKKNTFGPSGVRVRRISVFDQKGLIGESLDGVIAGPLAEKIRDGGAERMIAELA